MISRSSDIRSALRSRQRGFLLNPARFGGGGGGGGGGDPSFPSVSLLLPCNGTPGSTSFPDSSSFARTVTAFGNAQVSTTQSKFGGASVFFDGTGDYLQCANSTGFFFGSGDFTVETWIYPTVLSGFKTLLSYTNGSAAASNYSFHLYLSGTSLIQEIVSGSTVYGASCTGVVLNAWNHVAGARVGNFMRAFVSGALGGTVSNVGVFSANNPAGAVFQAGQLQGVLPYTGYMDDIRITKGVGRYSAAFTPPTTAFPNSA